MALVPSNGLIVHEIFLALLLVINDGQWKRKSRECEKCEAMLCNVHISTYISKNERTIN